MSAIASVAMAPPYQPPKPPQAAQPQPVDPGRGRPQIAATDSDGDNDGSRGVDIKA
jgi:hypothetical protein